MLPDLIIPKGIPQFNLLKETQHCCFCGNQFMPNQLMWEYPDNNYMCSYCKTRLEKEKHYTYSPSEEKQ